VLTEQYNIVYRCTVTGQTSTKNKVQKGAVPKTCTGNPANCVVGPKTPMVSYSAESKQLVLIGLVYISSRVSVE